MAECNGVEINDEMLEDIAAGALTEEAANKLRAIVAVFKASGVSLEQIYEEVGCMKSTPDWDKIEVLIALFYQQA